MTILFHEMYCLGYMSIYFLAEESQKKNSLMTVIFHVLFYNIFCFQDRLYLFADIVLNMTYNFGI